MDEVCVCFQCSFLKLPAFIFSRKKRKLFMKNLQKTTWTSSSDFSLSSSFILCQDMLCSSSHFVFLLLTLFSFPAEDSEIKFSQTKNESNFRSYFWLWLPCVWDDMIKIQIVFLNSAHWVEVDSSSRRSHNPHESKELHSRNKVVVAYLQNCLRKSQFLVNPRSPQETRD